MDKSNIIKLVKKHTYMYSDEMYLSKLEKRLDELLEKGLLNEKELLIAARFLFERGKYQKSLIQFSKLVKSEQYISSAYYGMYKCYLMLNDYETAYNYFLAYLKIKNNENLNNGSEIIISAFNIILNDNYEYKINCTENYLMFKLIDEDLKIKFKDLVDAYNLKQYQKCLLLADECERICRGKDIKLEFLTFKHLLKKVNEHSMLQREQNSQKIYIQLKNAITNHEYDECVDLINMIPKINLDNKIVYNAIYILIKNNYIEESKNILDKFIINNKNKIKINILQNAIKNQTDYNNLSEIEKDNFNDSINIGHDYYVNKDLEKAYYTYKQGEYLTNQNIFLYYIGKILFKLGKYNEAEEYLKRYIKVGSDKITKAYLYLAHIYKINKDYKKATYCAKKVDELNKIFLSDFQMHCIYDKKDKKIDSLKLSLQKKADIK